MSRSVPEDDMMDAQQSKDLGHPTKPQPDQAKDAGKEGPAEQIEDDVRANRGLGTQTRPREKSDTEKAMERATDRSKR
ncbi:hypothetical protein [Chelativorans sp.]|uniref:hypothetical protein n=1 Tax=Chelativorans sp. TaxID=2203393 RepID=UPI002810D833|nr:hypothetical protein [Chelativorans sp.]